MPELSIGFTARIERGPQISISRVIPVDAYEKLDVVVKPGESVHVAAQPGDLDSVGALVICSDLYGEELSYVISDGGQANSMSLPLTQPQCFLGGAVKVFGYAPKVIKFTNEFEFHEGDTSKVAHVQVLIGRDAVIQPNP